MSATGTDTPKPYFTLVGDQTPQTVSAGDGSVKPNRATLSTAGAAKQPREEVLGNWPALWRLAHWSRSLEHLRSSEMVARYTEDLAADRSAVA